MAYKPGSVRPCGVDDYSSRPRIAAWLKQPTRLVSRRKTPSQQAGTLSLFGLAPGEVCRGRFGYPSRGGLLPHRFTLTSPLRAMTGGLFSVALSLGLRQAGVTRHRFLRSPDFPRGNCFALRRHSPRPHHKVPRSHPAIWFSQGIGVRGEGLVKMLA